MKRHERNAQRWAKSPPTPYPPSVLSAMVPAHKPASPKRRYMAAAAELAPDVRPKGLLVGTIEVGEVYAWEPWSPGASELAVVSRIQDRPGDERLIWTFDLNYDRETWNEESRFREAAHRTLFRRFPAAKPLPDCVLPDSIAAILRRTTTTDADPA